MSRTNAEWMALIRALRDLINDPRETPERKRKAQNILDQTVRPTASAYHPDGARHHRANLKPQPLQSSDLDYNEKYDGRIV